MSSYRASLPQNSPMPPLKQAECHDMQVWCACTQRSPRQDKRRHSKTVYLWHAGLCERVLLLSIPPLQSSCDGLHLKKSGKSEAQMWTQKGCPPSQITPKDWRRTCCPPTDSFFLNMAIAVSPYSWLLWIWNTEKAPDTIKTLLSAWQQRQYSRWEGWSSGSYKSQAELAQNAKSNNISMASA